MADLFDEQDDDEIITDGAFACVLAGVGIGCVLLVVGAWKLGRCIFG